MAFTAFRDMKPFPQLMFSIFVVIVSFIAFIVLSLAIAIPLFGFNSMLNMTDLSQLNDPETLNILKFFQVVQAIGVFIIPPLVLGYLFYGNILDYLHLNKSFTFSSLFLVVVIMFFASPFINFTGELNSNMHLPEWMSGIEAWMRDSEDKAALLTKAFLKVDTIWGLLFNIFMIAVLPAIGEELLFRGVIQRIFTLMTKSNHWGVWISAILFSALHMQFYGFIPRMLLGVLFGYLLVWSGSMWLPIAAHFINNGFAVVAMYMIDKGMMNPDVENFGAEADTYVYTTLSVVFVSIFLYLYRKQNTGNFLSPENLS